MGRRDFFYRTNYHPSKLFLLNFIASIRHKLQSQGIQKYLKNTSWLLSEQMLTMGIGFVIGVIVARYLGKEDFGWLNYALSMVVFYTVFSELGMRELVLRNIVKEPERVPELMGTALGLRLLAAGVAFIGILVMVYLMGGTSTIAHKLIIVIGAGIFFKSFGLIEPFFHARVESRFAVRVKVAAFVVFSLARLTLVLCDMPLVWFGAAYLANEVLMGLGFVVMYQWQRGDLFRWKFDLGYAPHLLRDAWPLFLTGFVIIVYMKIDQVMIVQLLGPEKGGEQNGIYAAAARLFEIWVFLPLLLNRAFYPAIVEGKKLGASIYKERVQRLIDVSVVLGLMIAIGISLIGPWLVVKVYGAPYAAAGAVLVINIWAHVFTFIGSAGHAWLLTENLQKISLYRTLLGAVVNIGLNLILIPRIGITGAAIATLVSQIMASYVGYALSKKTWPVFVMQTRALSLVGPISQLKHLRQ